jgi:thiosulfate/3-mercaptopyruvate sulfurtransferase
MFTTLISAQDLHHGLHDPTQDWMVFDCSFDLLQPTAGHQQYLQAHIPGAQRADLDKHLSAQANAPRCCGGRHPLPKREEVVAWLHSLGFGRHTQAVVYDRQGVNYCGRLWWMLKWLGHEAVAVLDGGLQAWQAGGFTVESGPAPAPADTVAERFELGESKAPMATTAEVLARLGRPSQTVLDARARARYLGEIEPLDPVAGHIPGALNRPFADNLGTDGRFKPAAQLRSEFEAVLAGRAPPSVVHHCGSGVSSVPNVLAMEVAGLGRTALYAGSWSEWCADPSRPMARG